MSFMFNQICINEEMLPKYIYIYICVCVCVCVCVFLYICLCVCKAAVDILMKLRIHVDDIFLNHLILQGG